MKLVFATNNSHKLQEARQILSTKVEVLSLSDINCHDDIPETATTLEGNSLLKAQYIWDKYHLNCFADDTGLEIDALCGEPGVYSARYAGPPSNPADNRAKVLGKMLDKTERNAQFRTVITLIIDGQIRQVEGIVRGNIATHEIGDKAFGYDCIFIPEGYSQTFGCLPTEVKNRISHRAHALEKLSLIL